MNQLIVELKAEHGFLAEKLTEVRKQGRISPEAKETLFGCKQALLSHLKKEDDQLYPVLRKAAETDVRIKSMLERFAKDMEGISNSALGFFAKYEKDQNNPDFIKDVANLLAVLGGRISKEERILYPKYENVIAKQ